MSGGRDEIEMGQEMHAPGEGQPTVPRVDASRRAGTHRCSALARPGEKRVGAPDVLGVLGATLANVLFQQGHPGHAHQQHRHQQRAHHAPPRACRQRDEVQPPPHAEVAEVVGMPRPAPQPAIHHPALVRRVGLEAAELPVAPGLEHETHQPQQRADRIQRPQRGSTHRGTEQRQRNDPRQHRLQHKHQIQALQRKARLVALADRLIAPILAVPPAAHGDVQRKPQAPDAHQHHHQQATRTRRRRAEHVDARLGDKHQRPDAVDDRHVALGDAQQPGGNGHHQDRAEAEGVEEEVVQVHGGDLQVEAKGFSDITPVVDTTGGSAWMLRTNSRRWDEAAGRAALRTESNPVWQPVAWRAASPGTGIATQHRELNLAPSLVMAESVERRRPCQLWVTLEPQSKQAAQPSLEK